MIRTLLLVAVAAVLLAGSTVANPECIQVEGTFVNTAVPPPECTSPVLFCTHGDLEGDIDGDYYFVMTSQTPDLSGPPGTMSFTGESTITFPDGQMLADDTGTITFRVPGMSPFETHVWIYGGTGAYEGVTGKLVATGEYDLVAGAGSGTYTGIICS